MQEGYDKKNPNVEPEKKINLAEWGKMWLQTKGMNKISIESTQESDKYTEFKLKQTPCQYADTVYRTQMINMSLFDDKGSLIEKVSRVKVEN